MTVIGVIGGDPFDSYFECFRKTNKASVLAFLNAFINTHYRGNPNNLYIVTDNHTSHHSHVVQNFITRSGFRMIFTPAMSCALNPIEHFWSTVKTLWSKQMSKLSTDYDQEPLLREVNSVVS
jgi:transposase